MSGPRLTRQERRERARPSRCWRKAHESNWPEIAEALPLPWPEAAVLEDLGWWLDQVELGRVQMPGRPHFRARWGWTDHAVRTVLRDVLKVASGSPADRQPVASGSPAPERDEAEYQDDIASGSPARRQPVASGSPALVDQTQTADADTDNKGPSPALPLLAGEAPPAEVDPVEVVAAEWWRLWEIRRAGKPRGAPRSSRLNREDREAIKRAVTGKKPPITVDEAIMICRWAFYGDDWHAQHLRGEHEGQVQNAYLSPVSAYKPTKIGEKVTKARAFMDARAKRRIEVQRQTTAIIEDDPAAWRGTPPPADLRGRFKRRDENVTTQP